MKEKAMNNLIIENAQLIFKNFSGTKGRFNPEGLRNFCVLLDSDVAKELKDDGWNVKYLRPREEGDEEQAYLQVKVRFDNRPPKIIIVSSTGKSQINEDEVNILDWAEIENIDLNINPYKWERNGDSGITAYLKSMFVTIEQDPLEEKYIDFKDSAHNCIGGCGNCDVCDHEGACKNGD